MSQAPQATGAATVSTITTTFHKCAQVDESVAYIAHNVNAIDYRSRPALSELVEEMAWLWAYMI